MSTEIVIAITIVAGLLILGAWKYIDHTVENLKAEIDRLNEAQIELMNEQIDFDKKFLQWSVRIHADIDELRGVRGE